MNIFIGGNGAGKSNILEAIGIAASCLGRGLRDSDISAKGVRLTPPEIMKSSFKGFDLPKTFELDSKFDCDVQYKATLTSSKNEPFLKFFAESATHKNKHIMGRSYRGARAVGIPFADRLDKHRGLWDQARAILDVPLEFANEIQNFSNFAIFTPQTDVLRGRKEGKQDVVPIGLNGEGLPNAVNMLLQQNYSYDHSAQRSSATNVDRQMHQLCKRALGLVWLPGWAEQVKVDRLHAGLTSSEVLNRSSQMVYFIDRYMQETRNKLSVYDSSEGTLFLLFAAVLLTHPEAPRIFALDNVDNALNPALTRELVQTIVDTCNLANDNLLPVGAQQVFLTSHNPTSLDAFDIFDEEQRIFIVSRDSRGRTVANRLQPTPGMTRDQWELAKNGRNLSQLWLDGEISAALGKI